MSLNIAAWAVYVAPLGRLYALEEHLDRSFAVGMAACVAAGNTPFDHTQVNFANLEPFWSALVAALTFFRPERVIPMYHWLTPLSLLTVGLGLYYGLRQEESTDDAWERVLFVFAVIGLSSFSLSQRAPIPPLWAGNFLLKPNHGSAWALVGIGLGLWARRARPWVLGLSLGLLAWVFILDWAFLLAGLFAATLLCPGPKREWRRLLLATGISTAIAAPYLRHLTRDHSPFGTGGTPQQIWLDPLGRMLAAPEWATLDLGPLLLLGIGGALVLRRRRSRRDLALLGLLTAMWALWLVYEAGAVVGVSPEPDEHHYFLRIAMALAAGSALAAAGRFLETTRPLVPGRGHLLVMAAFLPLSFPAHWDPPSMDRYFAWCLPPLPADVLEYGRWVREHTPPEAVFLAGRSASVWIPALAGRRVLLTDISRPPADYEERKEAERILITSRELGLILRTARKFGITHLAIDAPMSEEYGAERLTDLDRLGVYEPLYENAAVRIFRVRGSDAARE